MSNLPTKVYTATWSEHPVWKNLGLSLGIVALLLIYIPIFWLVLMSFTGDPLSGFPGNFTTKWYFSLGEHRNWLQPLFVSLAIASGVSLVSMVCATIVGRTVSRLRRKAMAVTVLAVTLLPLAIPGVIIGTALFLYFRVLLGFKMGVWSLCIGHFVWAFPFALLAVLVVALRFDPRLLDSAADLGAGPFERFWTIEFPLLKDGVIAGGLFAFLLSFNEIARSIYLKGRTETLPVYIWQQAASHSSHVVLIYSLNVLILIASTLLVGFAFRLLFGKNTQ